MSNKALTSDELLTALVTAMTALREAEGDMNLSKAQTLLHVYLQPGIAQMDVPAVVDTSNPAATRNVQDWALLNRKSQPGRGFIRQVQDPENRKRYLLSPTSKGQDFLRKMTARVNEALSKRA